LYHPILGDHSQIQHDPAMVLQKKNSAFSAIGPRASQSPQAQEKASLLSIPCPWEP